MITQIEFSDIPYKHYYSENNTFLRQKESQDVKQYYYMYKSYEVEFYIKSVKDVLNEDEILDIYIKEKEYYSSFDKLEDMVTEAIDSGSYITLNMESGWYYFNKSIKKYLIHDNGGRPFKVIVDFDKKHIKVYKFDHDEVDDNSEEHEIIYDILVYETDFIDVFIGSSNEFFEVSVREYQGNSILVQTDGTTYTFIGDMIYSFTSIQQIDQYYSPIGNNDVPYPYAIGKTHIYIMLDKEKTDYLRKKLSNMKDTLPEPSPVSEDGTPPKPGLFNFFATVFLLSIALYIFLTFPGS
jgi:hypothetical protein